MFLPIGDAPNPKGIAPVNTLLVATNVAVFLFLTMPLIRQVAPSGPALDELLARMGASPADRPDAYSVFIQQWGFRPSNPSIATVFTSMFLHLHAPHLFVNMVFLGIFGNNVEAALGRGTYLFVYLASGIAASILYTLLLWNSRVPCVGASGAISGVLGFYLLAFPLNRVRMVLLGLPFFVRVFEFRSRPLLVFYLVVLNILPMLLADEKAGVAYGGHVGGFIAGIAFAWWYGFRDIVAPRPFRQGAAATSPATALQPISSRIAAGRWGEAAAAYLALPVAQTRHLLSAEQAIALGEGLRRSGAASEALAVAGRGLRDGPDAAAAARLHLLAGEILLDDLDRPVDAFQHLCRVLALEPEGATVDAARDRLAAIERMQKNVIGRRRPATATRTGGSP